MKKLGRSCGFTLVELVAVLVIAGVLAAVAAPRFFDTNVFQSRGFSDQVQATLRYAQKVAIAQRRNVCVAMTASAITLSIANAPGAASPCGLNLALPAGGNLVAPSGVTISGEAAFHFDAVGKPSVGTAVVVGTTTITVETETGYVHQ